MNGTETKQDGDAHKSAFDIASARSRFPALKSKQVFFDNAGGTQILGTVVESYAFTLSYVLCKAIT